jgi:hypothetical protein
MRNMQIHKAITDITYCNVKLDVRTKTYKTFYSRILRGADKSLAFHISYLQHNQKNFSWVG